MGRELLVIFTDQGNISKITGALQVSGTSCSFWFLAVDHHTVAVADDPGKAPPRFLAAFSSLLDTPLAKLAQSWARIWQWSLLLWGDLGGGGL